MGRVENGTDKGRIGSKPFRLAIQLSLPVEQKTKNKPVEVPEQQAPPPPRSLVQGPAPPTANNGLLKNLQE
jgi:hypothetical protein